MTEDEVETLQEELCKKYDAGFSKPNVEKTAGIADNLASTVTPIHGLRHPTTGWFIWAGEYSEAADFFKPMHLGHVLKAYPHLVPYLGLAPGWRFLIDPATGYEDIWRDTSLLIDD